MNRKLVLTVAFALLTGCAFAQGRFKAGVGVNYISNTYEQPHLYDYFAPSANLSYILLQRSKFVIALENVTSIRLSGSKSQADYKLGFTSSFPLLFSLDLNRIILSAGTGPAYVKQVTTQYEYDELASNYYLNNIVGVSFKGKPVLGGALQTEYSVRLSYLKGLSISAPEGGMISFIIFLKG